jgi:hypothetical protein
MARVHVAEFTVRVSDCQRGRWIHIPDDVWSQLALREGACIQVRLVKINPFAASMHRFYSPARTPRLATQVSFTRFEDGEPETKKSET